MPRTSLTPVVPKGPHPGTVAADGLDFAFTASDVANKNQFTYTGRELILVRNTDGAAAHNFTLTSIGDPQNRTQNIGPYSVGASEFAAFWAGDLVGWRQADGEFYLEADDAQIEFAVIRIP